MPTNVSADSPSGLAAVRIFGDVYNASGLDENVAKLLAEQPLDLEAGLASLISSLARRNDYAGEDICKWGKGPLSKDEKPLPVQKQVSILQQYFPTLVTCGRTDSGKALPHDADGHYAIPRWQALAPSYAEATNKVLRAVRLARRFVLPCSVPPGLQELPRSAWCWQKVAERQQADVLVVSGQWGLLHRGRSARRARAMFDPDEFGLGSFAIAVILLTHEHVLRGKDSHLSILALGDALIKVHASGVNLQVPLFRTSLRQLRIKAGSEGLWNVYGCAASAWLP